jgi:hypothetical protein
LTDLLLIGCSSFSAALLLLSLRPVVAARNTCGVLRPLSKMLREKD